MGIFTLEVVKAKHGDCLLLHYGPTDKPRLAMIDAGPPGVYKSFLVPRLDELREKLKNGDGELPLELVMVSHVDQDHVYGVRQLLREMARDLDDKLPSRFDVRLLWHNAFHRLAGDPDAGGDQAAVARAAIEAVRPEPASQLVLASVPEGHETASLAKRLNIPRNDGTLLLAGHAQQLPGDLGLAVVGPSQARVDALRAEWAQVIGAQPEELSPASLDDSVFNLSSLIVVASFDGRRMLLTGDALASDILDGLAAEGLLDGDGKAHFDILKIPHHGSDRNVDTKFFERVTADHYVISGDGAHGNPEPATLKMLDQARAGADYDIWFTYRDGLEGLGANLGEFIASRAKGDQGLHFPTAAEPSLKIDLVDAVDY
jgi:hypothetical protein